MFKKMKGLDVAFRYVRTFTMILILSYTVLLTVVLFQWHVDVKTAYGHIYVLANGKVLQAFVSGRQDNLVVEAKDHIKVLHEAFFSLDPDEKVIHDNIGKALYLGDESVKKQYDNLKESGYYSDVISANISQRVTVDSIILNTDVMPYYFRFYGKERIVRTSNTATRSLITEGYLRETQRSEHNPHGFLVSRWTILENNDLISFK